MAEFVGEDVVEAGFIVDDLFGELDGAVVADGEGGVCREGSRAETELLAAPVGAAGGCFEGFGPDEFDAAGGGGERGDLALGDGCVEGGEEGAGEGVFGFGKSLALGAEGVDVGCCVDWGRLGFLGWTLWSRFLFGTGCWTFVAFVAAVFECDAFHHLYDIFSPFLLLWGHK